MTDEEVDELFEDIDTDGDGKLDKNGKAATRFWYIYRSGYFTSRLA